MTGISTVIKINNGYQIYVENPQNGGKKTMVSIDLPRYENIRYIKISMGVVHKKYTRK